MGKELATFQLASLQNSSTILLGNTGQKTMSALSNKI
jgi:hypothetical protein